MPNILTKWLRLLKEATTVPEIVAERDLDDLIKYASLIDRDIRKAQTVDALKRCTELTDLLLLRFGNLDRCAYWMNRLHTRITIRFCEIIGHGYEYAE